MSKMRILPKEYESCITECINQRFEEHKLKDKYLNQLIKEDVLEMLDDFCTVVYYPIPDKSNQGLHITDILSADCKPHSFVFINTAQTMEKQAFTAAHELGHLWNVDEFVCKKMNISHPSTVLREDIVNRFAAVLMMPAEPFRKSAVEIFKNLSNNGNIIVFSDILKMVAMLMNRFFAPQKAVIRRMCEVGLLDEVNARALLGEGQIPKTDINSRLAQIIFDLGYTKLQTSNEKKWIEGLAEQLDIAEQRGVVAQSKIEHIRELFDITKPTPIDRTDVFTVNTSEGIEKNAT